MEQPRLEEVYEALVREAYDDTKRPPQMSIVEALGFAWDKVIEHGLSLDRMYEIHARIRDELNIK